MNSKQRSTLNYIGAGALATGAVVAAPFTGGASLAAVPLATAWGQNTANRQAQDAQNRYNSPASQMARYREAGLNPNLIYSQGNPGNQSQPVQFEVPEIDPQGVRGVKAKYDNVNLQNQINRYNAQAAYYHIDQIHADTLLKETKQIGEVTKNQMLDTQLPYARGNALEMYRGNKARAEVLMSEVQMKAAQLANFQMDNRIKSEVLRDKQYSNWLRQFGIERTDNIFLRGGVRALHQLEPQLRKAWQDNQKSKP